MKTKEKKSEHGGLLLTCLLALSTLISKTGLAAATAPAADTTSSQNYVSFYIIGIILGVGITGFIIVSIREKKQKQEEDHSNIKHISHHRHHHHNRVVKKSA